MAGYYKYSMSNNAVDAYMAGEKPLSKWRKADILDTLSPEQREAAKGMSLAALCELFLEYRGWHHTSSHYNRTEFYGIAEWLDEITVEQIKDAAEQDKKEREEKRALTPKKSAPKFVTAKVSYVYWTGTRNHPKRHEVHGEIVHFMSNEKMVKTAAGMKRLSSLTIEEQAEADDDFPKI